MCYQAGVIDPRARVIIIRIRIKIYWNEPVYPGHYYSFSTHVVSAFALPGMPSLASIYTTGPFPIKVTSFFSQNSRKSQSEFRVLHELDSRIFRASQNSHDAKMCPRRRARTRAGTRTRAALHAARGRGGSRARVHSDHVLGTRGTPDKVFELIFIQLLSRSGAVNARGCSQGFWHGTMGV